LAFLRFSRGCEEEADLLALQYLYAAGYDPGSYVAFFEKLAEKKRPNFLVRVFSTHPPTADRIKRCQRIVNEYFPDKEAYQVTTSEFATIHERLAMIIGLKNKGPELRRRTQQ
ncbi:MAG: peptidase M48, partial [Acidobacteria bacterium]